MALIKYKPTSPGARTVVKIDRSHLHKGGPHLPLTGHQNKTGARTHSGRMTTRHQGGGSRQKYRIIDFKRDKDGIAGVVERIEYDPNRTGHIALIKYADGERRYILAPKGVTAGDEVRSGADSPIKPGNAMQLRHIPVGTIIHNVELRPKKGGQLARAAGTFVQLVGLDIDYALIRLGSGEVRKVHLDCLATIGAVSNPDHMNASIGKAGRSRWLGRRPHNRGVTMNPVDHPHGGGEGRTSGGRHPVTPWGKPTKGKKTRTNKSTTKFIVTSRHKSKKKG
jgi:large subunit ribosomal protein L2